MDHNLVAWRAGKMINEEPVIGASLRIQSPADELGTCLVQRDRDGLVALSTSEKIVRPSG
ncbi:hypothetical protein [Rhodopseudomonas parapalustris]